MTIRRVYKVASFVEGASLRKPFFERFISVGPLPPYVMVPETIRQDLSDLGVRGLITSKNQWSGDLFGHVRHDSDSHLPAFDDRNLPPGVSIVHVDVDAMDTYLGFEVDPVSIVYAPFSREPDGEFGANTSEVSATGGTTGYMWAFEGTDAAEQLRASSYATGTASPGEVGFHRDHSYYQVIDG